MNNEIKTQIYKNEKFYWVVSEASFFAFLYYAQHLLKIGGNLWWSSLILWTLLNLSIIFCPVLRKLRK